MNNGRHEAAQADLQNYGNAEHCWAFGDYGEHDERYELHFTAAAHLSGPRFMQQRFTAGEWPPRRFFVILGAPRSARCFYSHLALILLSPSPVFPTHVELKTRFETHTTFRT